MPGTLDFLLKPGLESLPKRFRLGARDLDVEAVGLASDDLTEAGLTSTTDAV
jgi:hypothetical protein